MPCRGRLLAIALGALELITSLQNEQSNALIAGLIVLTVLSPTEVFPTVLRKEWVEPYHLKALPAVLVWVAMQWPIYQGLLSSRPSSLSSTGQTD